MSSVRAAREVNEHQLSNLVAQEEGQEYKKSTLSKYVRIEWPQIC